MAKLIIGHTTHESVLIWVRGYGYNPAAFLNLYNENTNRNRKIVLEERFGCADVFNLGSLVPETEYRCSVSFGRTVDEPISTRVDFGHTSGMLKIFPEDKKNAELRFLFGSCNLNSMGMWQNPDANFRTLLKISKTESVDFMIHVGDQIYYDGSNFLKWPYLEEYRKKYIDAWGDSRPTRKLLTQLPHYYDHELVDNCSNDIVSTKSDATPGDIKKHGLRVYREFQHIHNPDVYGNQALYYNYNFGVIKFFCLDTRSERIEHAHSGRTMMIDDVQMTRFKTWLTKHRNAIKFVVTRVPFVGHVENNTDKWCSHAFRIQHEEIIKHVLDKNITGLTFLAGDMHNSYHATLEIVSSDKKNIIHELMPSPVNQTSKSSLGKYLRPYKIESKQGFECISNIVNSEFFNDHSNAMLVKVKNRRMDYEIFRTQTHKRKEVCNSYSV